MRTTRAQVLADARALLDWLEAHPDVPVPGFEWRRPVLGETDGEKLAELERIATAAGAPIVDAGSGHRNVTHRIGSATYQATAIECTHMDAYERHMEPWHAEMAMVDHEGGDQS